MKSTCIYLITNIDNDPSKGYIGKTVNFNTRKYDHLKKLGRKIEINIIDEVESDWKFWESYWIEQFKNWNINLTNKNKGGGGPEFRTPENLKIIVQKLHKPIQQFDKNLNLVKEWSSIKEAKASIRGNIDGCLRGGYKTAGGFYWRYKSLTQPYFNTSSKKGKKVYQYDLNMNLLNIFNSTQEAERSFNTSGTDNIGACCRNEQKTAYGYVWKYKKQ